jgi:hypothetical protein
MLARIGHALYYAPITQLCGCGIASNRSAHAEHGQKRCLATGNPAHPEESLNLGLSTQKLRGPKVEADEDARSSARHVQLKTKNHGA